MMAKFARRYHIIIDAVDCNPELITDKDKVGKAIMDITGLCQMQILHGPVVIEGLPTNPGITGFAVIEFSHISVHTFVPSNEICVDIFSCKEFDQDAVKKHVKETFGLKDENTKVIDVK
jgi:S-adenosylmethionine decarboxylase